MERHFRVDKEAPDFRPSPREGKRESDASSCIRRIRALPLAPVRERLGHTSAC